MEGMVIGSEGASAEELLNKDSMSRKLFERMIKRRQFKEIEGREREEKCFECMDDIQSILAAREREKDNPFFLADLLRILLYFQGYPMVDDARGDNLLENVSYEMPVLKGEWAETTIVTVYRYYSNDSGFMSLEELLRFFADSGVINTHCPHTAFDEPVMEVAEQLDPLRMIVTLPPVGVLGINNPQENVASAALQEALKNDPYSINFPQFFSILLRISQIVYPSLYIRDKKSALNKVLTESVLPLYAWCLGHDKQGVTDVMVSDERIALLLMTYAPNLWRVFLAYSQDSSNRPPQPDLAYPSYAQACERAFFGVPKFAPYTPPVTEQSLSQADAFTASGLQALASSRDKHGQQRAFLDRRVLKENSVEKVVVKGSVAARRELHKRYSFAAQSAREINNSESSRYAPAGGISTSGSTSGSTSTRESVSFVEKTTVGDKGTGSGVKGGQTRAQAQEKQAAKHGFYLSESKCMQMMTDYGLTNHLVSRTFIKQLFRKLNRKKNVTVGLASTKVDSKVPSAASTKSMTMSQKVKSRRASVVNSLDSKYLQSDDNARDDPITYQGRINDKIGRRGVVEKGSLYKKPVVSNKVSAVNLNGGLSFSEFLEFLSYLALEGMSTEHYHHMFDTPFKKVLALLTVWGIADLKKLEEVLLLHVDIVV
jgi:hypothetical protein